MGCVSGQVGWWGLDRQARHLGCPDASEPQNNIVNVSVKKQEAWIRHTRAALGGGCRGPNERE